MSNDFILCGWRVRSSLAIPELLPWQGNDRSVDVEISLGQIPERTEEPISVLPHSRLWADGAFLLELDDMGRFWVEGGCRVVVEPAPEINEAELRGFILGSVLGVLCHQRGLLPIHASAVRIGGRAILIAGNSGAGKSTLAAALGIRGHALVADDVAAFDPGLSMVLPAFPQRKLALDVMEAMTLDHVGLIPNRPGQPKFRVPALNGFDSAPLQPLAVYILSGAAPGKSGGFERQSTATSMAELDRMIYRRGTGMKIQPPHAVFHAIGRLAQMAPVYILSMERILALSDLGKLAEQVEYHALASTALIRSC